MTKITGSSFDMYDKSEKAAEYRNCVEGVIDSNEVGMLGDYVHHHFTTRLQHSMNVSYYSFTLCRFLGWDYRSAARAGLMHDLYFFDNKVETGTMYLIMVGVVVLLVGLYVVLNRVRNEK